MTKSSTKPVTSKRSRSSAGTRERRPAPKKTKKRTCIQLLNRPKGATLAELSKATGWQSHSVRGFLSATVRKIEGITLATDVEAGKPRRYRITESAKKA